MSSEAVALFHTLPLAFVVVTIDQRHPTTRRCRCAAKMCAKCSERSKSSRSEGGMQVQTHHSVHGEFTCWRYALHYVAFELVCVLTDRIACGVDDLSEDVLRRKEIKRKTIRKHTCSR